MFHSQKVPVGDNGEFLEYRRENLTGFSCRIAPERIKRGLNLAFSREGTDASCPFCEDHIVQETPCFPDGKRIFRGESTTFPNKFPFAAWHTVTVITRAHSVEKFTPRQVADALTAQVESLRDHDGYANIIWNYLPSSGASLSHPHMQGLVDPFPSYLVSRYLSCGEQYLRKNGKLYWKDLEIHERTSPRYLFGDEIPWMASPVPLGEREVRALLPVRHIGEFASFIDTFAEGVVAILEFYRRIGTVAFNMGIFFDKNREDRGFRAFCSLIARMSPNTTSASDSSAMERLHFEPVILTLPENLADTFRNLR